MCNSPFPFQNYITFLFQLLHFLIRWYSGRCFLNKVYNYWSQWWISGAGQQRQQVSEKTLRTSARHIQLCVQTCSNSSRYLFLSRFLLHDSTPPRPSSRPPRCVAPKRQEGYRKSGSCGSREKVHKSYLCPLDTAAVAFSTWCPATLENKNRIKKKKDINWLNIDERQRKKT